MAACTDPVYHERALTLCIMNAHFHCISNACDDCTGKNQTSEEKFDDASEGKTEETAVSAAVDAVGTAAAIPIPTTAGPAFAVAESSTA